eukprot:1155641-Pelagomonas_calceolata.AAC.3
MIDWCLDRMHLLWKQEQRCYTQNAACLTLPRCTQASSFRAGKCAYIHHSMNGGVTSRKNNTIVTQQSGGQAFWV